MHSIFKIWKLIKKSSLAVTAVLLLIICIVAVYSDSYIQMTLKNNMRTDATSELNLLEARIVGHLNNDIQLVRGITYAIKTEPSMNQQRFSDLATHLFHNQSLLNLVAAAPNLVNTVVFPYEKYQSVIGMDYYESPEYLNAALDAKRTNEVVLAGPINLKIGGGAGIIARFPIFLDDKNPDSFWGIVSAVINADKLFEASGLNNLDLPIDIAIVGKDGKGASGEQFFGSIDVLNNNPVSITLSLPVGSWQLYAVPKGGWIVPAEVVWYERATIVFSALLIFIPIATITLLANRQQKLFDQLILRESELQTLSTRLKLALDTSEIGVFEYNLVTGGLLWDKRMIQMFEKNIEKENINYQTWESSIHPDDLDRVRAEMQAGIQREARFVFQYRIILPSSKVKTIRAIIEFVKDEFDNQKLIGVNWDVTADMERAAKLETNNKQLLKANNQVVHLALHDALTGLPNRYSLEKHLDDHGMLLEENNLSAAILVIDLDDFKEINDNLGHAAGDAALLHVAKILKRHVREDDLVARVGGDEFIILCQNNLSKKRLEELSRSILADMDEPSRYQDNDIRVAASIGIAVVEKENITFDKLQKNADLALYEAKRCGKNKYEAFTDSLGKRMDHAKFLEEDIYRGLNAGEFIPFYQLQFDASSQKPIGMEALARWNHPEHGILTPNKFLQTADSLNLSSKIDYHILIAALNDIKKWKKKGFDFGRVSVNISTQSLESNELINALEQIDIPKNSLSFELLESIFFDDDHGLLLENIKKIKSMGISIEIDDFGTGNASFISLLKTNPERLKIDQQFVRPTENKEACRQIIKSFVEVASSLNVEVVAEGVETMEQAYLMRELGCHILQGYVFAKPVPAEEIEIFEQKYLNKVG